MAGDLALQKLQRLLGERDKGGSEEAIRRGEFNKTLEGKADWNSTKSYIDKGLEEKAPLTGGDPDFDTVRWNAAIERVPGDCNAEMVGGFFVSTTWSNGPETGGLLEVCPSTTSANVIHVFTSFATAKKYMRVRALSVWAGWVEIGINPPSRLSTAIGLAPSYSARAWVNFNGAGTVAIRASGNVTSITDNGTGDYTINFTTAMPDTNYGVTGSANGSGSSTPQGNAFVISEKAASGVYSLKTVNAAAIIVVDNNSDTLFDAFGVTAVVFR